jgi:hypothetical protein
MSNVDLQALGRCLHAASVLQAAEEQGIGLPCPKRIAAQWASDPVCRARWKRIATRALEIAGHEARTDDGPPPQPQPIRRMPAAEWETMRKKVIGKPVNPLVKKLFTVETIARAADTGTTSLLYLLTFLFGGFLGVLAICYLMQ